MRNCPGDAQCQSIISWRKTTQSTQRAATTETIHSYNAQLSDKHLILSLPAMQKCELNNTTNQNLREANKELQETIGNPAKHKRHPNPTKWCNLN